MVGLDIDYPSSIGLAPGGLGLAVCSPKTLAAFGPAHCPADARMGAGTALAEIPFGTRTLTESAHITILGTPEQDGHPAFVLAVEGGTPLLTRIVFPGLLLPTGTPAQEDIQLKVPLFTALPGGPYAAVTELDASIGSPHLIYHEQSHGRRVSYKPQGVLLPDRCPRGGFLFTAKVTFLDGSHTAARGRVTCDAPAWRNG